MLPGDKIDGLLGVPPSATRKFQPVVAIVKKMSEILSLTDLSKKLRKTKATRSLKSVLDPAERANELAGAFSFDGNRRSGGCSWSTISIGLERQQGKSPAPLRELAFQRYT